VVPGDLNIFPVGFKCLYNFDLVTFEYCFKWSSQNVILVHVIFIIKTSIIISLLMRNIFVPYIEEFLKTFASKSKFLDPFRVVVLDDCVTTSDVFD